MSSTHPNQFGRDNNTTHDSDCHEPVGYYGLPVKDQGSSRLRDRGMGQSRTINRPANTGPKPSKYGWKHCIVNRCGTTLRHFRSWKNHIRTFHQESVFPDSYRCMIDQCDREFNEEDPRKEWYDHITKRHRQSFPIRRTFKTEYGDGGRENLIPRDGTFLKRFVEQLSQNENIQGTKETADVTPHSENHHTKELDPGKSTNEGEAMEVLNEQSDHVGVTADDEMMEECQEAAEEQHMEEENRYAKGCGYEETAIEDEAMGEHKNAVGAKCTEGGAVIEDDEIDQLMEIEETDIEAFGRGEVSTRYEVMVEPM